MAVFTNCSACTAVLSSSPASEQTSIHCTLEVCYSTVRRHVVIGLPGGRFQSFGGPYVLHQQLMNCLHQSTPSHRLRRFLPRTYHKLAGCVCRLAINLQINYRPCSKERCCNRLCPSVCFYLPLSLYFIRLNLKLAVLTVDSCLEIHNISDTRQRGHACSDCDLCHVAISTQTLQERFCGQCTTGKHDY